MRNPEINTILDELHRLANPKAQSVYQKLSQKEVVLGVNRGPLRALASKYINNHGLALGLWDTELYEGRLMACMMLDTQALTHATIEKLLTSTPSISLIDELCFDVFDTYAKTLDFYQTYRNHANTILRRSAFNAAIAYSMKKSAEKSVLNDFLSTIEPNLLSEHPDVQYAMNRCMVEIGVRHDDFTDRCIAIGERLGLYKDMKVAKGCTSAYAPEWITVAKRNRQSRLK